MKKLSTTQVGIAKTKEIMESWGMLGGLTKNEIFVIENCLAQIAKDAIHDYKNAIDQLGHTVLSELK